MNRRSLLKGLLAAPLAMLGVKALEPAIPVWGLAERPVSSNAGGYIRQHFTTGTTNPETFTVSSSPAGSTLWYIVTPAGTEWVKRD